MAPGEVTIAGPAYSLLYATGSLSQTLEDVTKSKTETADTYERVAGKYIVHRHRPPGMYFQPETEKAKLSKPATQFCTLNAEDTTPTTWHVQKCIVDGANVLVFENYEGYNTMTNLKLLLVAHEALTMIEQLDRICNRLAITSPLLPLMYNYINYIGGQNPDKKNKYVKELHRVFNLMRELRNYCANYAEMEWKLADAYSGEFVPVQLSECDIPGYETGQLLNVLRGLVSCYLSADNQLPNVLLSLSATTITPLFLKFGPLPSVLDQGQEFIQHFQEEKYDAKKQTWLMCKNVMWKLIYALTNVALQTSIRTMWIMNPQDAAWSVYGPFTNVGYLFNRSFGLTAKVTHTALGVGALVALNKYTGLPWWAQVSDNPALGPCVALLSMFDTEQRPRALSRMMLVVQIIRRTCPSIVNYPLGMNVFLAVLSMGWPGLNFPGIGALCATLQGNPQVSSALLEALALDYAGPYARMLIATQAEKESNADATQNASVSEALQNWLSSMLQGVKTVGGIMSWLRVYNNMTTDRKSFVLGPIGSAFVLTYSVFNKADASAWDMFNKWLSDLCTELIRTGGKDFQAAVDSNKNRFSDAGWQGIWMFFVTHELLLRPLQIGADQVLPRIQKAYNKNQKVVILVHLVYLMMLIVLLIAFECNDTDPKWGYTARDNWKLACQAYSQINNQDDKACTLAQLEQAARQEVSTASPSVPEVTYLLHKLRTENAINSTKQDKVLEAINSIVDTAVKKEYGANARFQKFTRANLTDTNHGFTLPNVTVTHTEPGAEAKIKNGITFAVNGVTPLAQSHGKRNAEYIKALTMAAITTGDQGRLAEFLKSSNLFVPHDFEPIPGADDNVAMAIENLKAKTHDRELNVSAYTTERVLHANEMSKTVQHLRQAQLNCTERDAEAVCSSSLHIRVPGDAVMHRVHPADDGTESYTKGPDVEIISGNYRGATQRCVYNKDRETVQMMKKVDDPLGNKQIYTFSEVGKDMSAEYLPDQDPHAPVIHYVVDENSAMIKNLPYEQYTQCLPILQQSLSDLSAVKSQLEISGCKSDNMRIIEPVTSNLNEVGKAFFEEYYKEVSYKEATIRYRKANIQATTDKQRVIEFDIWIVQENWKKTQPDEVVQELYKTLEWRYGHKVGQFYYYSKLLAQYAIPKPKVIDPPYNYSDELLPAVDDVWYNWFTKWFNSVSRSLPEVSLPALFEPPVETTMPMVKRNLEQFREVQTNLTNTTNKLDEHNAFLQVMKKWKAFKGQTRKNTTEYFLELVETRNPHHGTLLSKLANTKPLNESVLEEQAATTDTEVNKLNKRKTELISEREKLRHALLKNKWDMGQWFGENDADQPQEQDEWTKDMGEIVEAVTPLEPLTERTEIMEFVESIQVNRNSVLLTIQPYKDDNNCYFVTDRHTALQPGDHVFQGTINATVKAAIPVWVDNEWQQAVCLDKALEDVDNSLTVAVCNPKGIDAFVRAVSSLRMRLKVVNATEIAKQVARQQTYKEAVTTFATQSGCAQEDARVLLNKWQGDPALLIQYVTNHTAVQDPWHYDMSGQIAIIMNAITQEIQDAKLYDIMLDSFRQAATMNHTRLQSFAQVNEDALELMERKVTNVLNEVKAAKFITQTAFWRDIATEGNPWFTSNKTRQYTAFIAEFLRDVPADKFKVDYSAWHAREVDSSAIKYEITPKPGIAAPTPIQANMSSTPKVPAEMQELVGTCHRILDCLNSQTLPLTTTVQSDDGRSINVMTPPGQLRSMKRFVAQSGQSGVCVVRDAGGGTYERLLEGSNLPYQQGDTITIFPENYTAFNSVLAYELHDFVPQPNAGAHKSVFVRGGGTEADCKAATERLRKYDLRDFDPTMGGAQKFLKLVYRNQNPRNPKRFHSNLSPSDLRELYDLCTDASVRAELFCGEFVCSSGIVEYRYPTRAFLIGAMSAKLRFYSLIEVDGSVKVINDATYPSTKVHEKTWPGNDSGMQAYYAIYDQIMRHGFGNKSITGLDDLLRLVKCDPTAPAPVVLRLLKITFRLAHAGSGEKLAEFCKDHVARVRGMLEQVVLLHTKINEIRDRWGLMDKHTGIKDAELARAIYNLAAESEEADIFGGKLDAQLADLDADTIELMNALEVLKQALRAAVSNLDAALDEQYKAQRIKCPNLAVQVDSKFIDELNRVYYDDDADYKPKIAHTLKTVLYTVTKDVIGTSKLDGDKTGYSSLGYAVNAGVVAGNVDWTGITSESIRSQFTKDQAFVIDVLSPIEPRNYRLGKLVAYNDTDGHWARFSANTTDEDVSVAARMGNRIAWEPVTAAITLLPPSSPDDQPSRPRGTYVVRAARGIAKLFGLAAPRLPLRGAFTDMASWPQRTGPTIGHAALALTP